MKTYLITGAAGFIGSHLAEALYNSGNAVINLDNFNDYYDKKIKIRNVLSALKLETKEEIFLDELKRKTDSQQYKLEVGDIRDVGILDKIFSENKIDMVINLAAMAGVRPSIDNPVLYEDVNVRGLINLLEACKKYGVKKFIQASSSSVYGNNSAAQYKESDIVDFSISPYAATKKAGEVMGHVYHKLYNIDMIQLRFFTVYGPRQRPDLAIYKFTKSILQGEEIPFYGDGSTERDYTYIDDIIDGILKSTRYLDQNNNVYEIINLGESRTISLSKMVITIEEKLQIKAKLRKLPMQSGDVFRTNADISKARAMIGYNPKTSFEKGIEKFIIWYKENNIK